MEKSKQAVQMFGHALAQRKRVEVHCRQPNIYGFWNSSISQFHLGKLWLSCKTQRPTNTNQGWTALHLQALFNSLQGVGFLEKTGRTRFAWGLVLMSIVSPFGLPLRVDHPGVDPEEWEDDED
jgi:hypothetical protein